jgi:integrase
VQEIELFFDSIRSKETRIKYSSYLKKYLKITGIENPLAEKDPKVIADQIIAFINKMKKEGKNWGAIHNYVSMILAFYKINDVVLNTTKINKFMPEQRKVKKDRGYTHEEISKLLAFADERMRAVILLLACTGMRIGAIPSLKISDVDDRKITVYENDKEEYFTFITPECKKAIDSYIDVRTRYGEKINDDSPLIREQFNIRDKFPIRKSKAIGRESLQWKLRDIARRSNVRSKQVPIAHGFRKFFTTQLIKSNLKTEARLRLEGHSTGITDHYWRPSDQDLLNEYMKAVNNLTINEENRLKIKVELLESKKNSYEDLQRRVMESEAVLKILLDERDKLTDKLTRKGEKQTSRNALKC